MWEKFLMWIELKLSAKNWDAKVYENFKQNWIVFFFIFESRIYQSIWNWNGMKSFVANSGLSAFKHW